MSTTPHSVTLPADLVALIKAEQDLTGDSFSRVLAKAALAGLQRSAETYDVLLEAMVEAFTNGGRAIVKAPDAVAQVRPCGAGSRRRDS